MTRGRSEGEQGGGARWKPDAVAVGFGPRFVVAISAGSVLNPINSSIIAVALVSIGRSFGVPSSTTAWLVSALYLATAVGQPTMGKLADRLGARRVYLAGVLRVALGGLGGYLAPTLGALVVARVAIGLGTSAAYPAAMTLVRRQSERLHRPAPGGVLAALAIAGQVSMAIGPPLGGLLIAIAGWPSIFLINVPLALLGGLAAVAWLPDDEPLSTALGTGDIDPAHRGASGPSGLWHTLDVPGLLLFAGALSSLLLFLMGLSSPTWALLALAVIALAVLIWWERRAGTPFIDVRMLAHNRALTATYLRYAATFLVTYCFIYGWTQWLEQSTGRSAAATGFLLVPSFVVAAAASALGARGRRVLGPLLIGTIALTAGSAGLLFLHASSPWWALIGISVLFGLPTGLNTIGNQAAMYAQAPADQIGVAAGLLRTFMYLGAVLSASLISITYQQRATDPALHTLAIVLTAASLCLLLATLASRGLRSHPPAPAAHRHIHQYGHHAIHLLDQRAHHHLTRDQR